MRAVIPDIEIEAADAGLTPAYLREVPPRRVDPRRVAAWSSAFVLHVATLLVLLLGDARPMPPLPERPRHAIAVSLEPAGGASAGGGGSVDAATVPSPPPPKAVRTVSETPRPIVRPKLKRTIVPPEPVAIDPVPRLELAAALAPVEVSAESGGSRCDGANCSENTSGAGALAGGRAGSGGSDDDWLGGSAPGPGGKGRYEPIDYRGVPMLPDTARIPPRCRYERRCVLVLRIFVDAHGARGEIQLLRSSGSRHYDRLMLSYARDWEFRPRRIDGRAVDGWAVVPVFAAR